MKGPTKITIVVDDCIGCDELLEKMFSRGQGKYHYYCKALPNPQQSQGLDHITGGQPFDTEKLTHITPHPRCPYKKKET